MDEQQTTTGPASASSGTSQFAGQSRADRIFETEELVLKAKMLESPFYERFILLIDQASLSKRAKLALASVASMAFDPNAILANNPDLEMRCLRFEEALNKAKLSYSRPDVMNPDIVYLHENLRQAFRDFVSRSYNMGERKMQGERKIVQQTNMATTDTSASAPQQQRKHGFDLIKEKLGM